MSYLRPAATPFLDLPSELICEIARWGQIIWLTDTFYDLPDLSCVKDDFERSTSIAHGTSKTRCIGSTGLITHCLRDETHPHLNPSFLETFGSVNKRIFYALRADKELRRLANTLYGGHTGLAGPPAPAPAYSTAVGGRIHYEDGVLVAERVCLCILSNLFSFSPSLKMIKITTVSQTGGFHASSVSNHLAKHLPRSDAPLEYYHICLDLPRYDRYTSSFWVRSPLRPMSSSNIRSCAMTNASHFLYGPYMHTLYISWTRHSGALAELERNFLNALQVCARCLRQLTLDLPDVACMIGSLREDPPNDPFEVYLPEAVPLVHLRYLRLGLPAEGLIQILKHLSLPSDIVEFHLDLRAPTAHIVFPSAAEGLNPAAGIELSRDTLWRFAASLVMPNQTSGIFSIPPAFNNTAHSQTKGYLGLGVQLNPETRFPFEPPTSAVPRRVALIWASTADGVQTDPFRSQSGSLQSDNGASANYLRRSLALTDDSPTLSSYGRASAPELWRTALYRGIQHVMALLSSGQAGTPFDGTGAAVKSITLLANSYLPCEIAGWGALLGQFPDVESLSLLSPVSKPGYSPGDDASEGFISFRHLEALAAYVGDETATLPNAGRLENILLPYYVPTFCAVEDVAGWLDRRANSQTRLSAGGHSVCWQIGLLGDRVW